MASQVDQYVVPGLDRALTILELLSEHPAGLSMVEIAAETGFPNNSVYRIAMTLRGRGYLRRSADTKRFTVTRKFLKLAFPSVHERNIVELSLDVMNELRDLVGESVLLAALHEGAGVVLAQSPAPHPIRLMVEPGTRFELHCSGPGKVMLAFLQEKQRKAQVATLDMKRYTPNTICRKSALTRELKTVRQQGYAVDRGESFEGVHCVAAPLFDEHGSVLASIWVSGPSSRLPESQFKEIGPEVLKSAKRISRRIGYYEQD